MPRVKECVSVDVETEFEMYCARCGTGICEYTRFRKRGANQFETSCPTCEKELEEALELISSLNDEVENLKEQLEKNK